MVTARRQPVVKGFNCANCGAAVEIRALTHTMSVACTSCGALLDPRDPNVFVLQEALRREQPVVQSMGLRPDVIAAALG